MDSSNLRNQLDQVKDGADSQDEDTSRTADAENESPKEEDTDPADAETGVSNPEETEETEETEGTEGTEGTEDTQNTTGPAFTAETSAKLSIYPSEDNARFIKVLCNSVENDLIALGHDNFEVREAHDAMVRFAHEHPRKVTQLVLEARDLDPDAIEDLP